MKKIISLLIAVIFVSSMIFPTSAFEIVDGKVNFTYDEWNEAILCDGYYYVDDGYDVEYTNEAYYDINYMAWNYDYDKVLDGYTVEFNVSFESCQDMKIKVPDSFKLNTSKKKPVYVKYISGSCAFKEFDLNPKNKYMKCVDNVVFSKDGKTLISYAMFDEREKYEIPNGTEIIGKGAIWTCDNIKEITMPDSVKEIKRAAFGAMEHLEKISISPLVEELPEIVFGGDDNLNEVYIPENSKLKKISSSAFEFTAVTELMLPSFDIEISNDAFGWYNESLKKLTLKSYVKPEVKAFYSSKNNTYKLKWDKISNASRYEVYQKLSDGSYKLIKETSKNSISFKNIKSGKRYTFAVKPIAEIKAIEDDEHSEIEYYTIEGTMSEECSFRGK